MQDTQNSRLYLRPKNDLHKTYQRLKGDDSKHFYQDLLTLMKTSIIENDSKKFRKFAELLEIINKSENNNRLREYFSGGNPLENTNVLLLSCEYGKSEIFSFILANYCNILNLDHTKGCISPVDENNDSNNSYYYLMRLNDVDTLKELIEKWQFALDPMELDTALSKAYVKLILQNVKLEDNMKFYVEFILNKTRLDCNPFGNLDVSMITFDDIKNKSLFTIDVASKLVLDYNNVKSITDDKFIYIVKFLALNLHMLKRLLTSTYDRLPWEEIEFCLVTYVKCFRCKEEQSVYYRSYLKKENILKYLSEFCKEFQKVINGLKENDLKSKKIDTPTRQAVVTEICNNNSTFKELSENFIKIRDYYTLRRIVSYLKPALTDKKENETDEKSDQNDESDEQIYQTDILVIEKCLQILGESLKNTLTTPNLSDEFCNLVFVSFSDELQKVIKEMRNSLSHKYGLRRRVGATDISIYSSENFLRIRKDLSKIYSLITNLLYHIHNKRLEEMFYELQNIKSPDSFQDYKELFNYGEIEFSSMGNLKLEDQYSEITSILQKLKLEILPLKDRTLELLFTELEDIIQSKSQSYNHTDSDLLGNSLLMVDYMIESNKNLSPSFFKCLPEELGLTNFNFDKPTSLSPQEESRILSLLGNIMCHALSRYDKSAKNIEMCALQISSFFLISDRKFNSLKEFNFTLKQTKKSKRQDIYLTEILGRKLNQLICIFKEYDLNESVDSLSNFIAIHGETQIFSAIEMLLLDILSINKDSLKFNMNLYNLVFPTLMGTELRNYLAHGNPVCETLGINVKLSILMNCLAYIKIKSSTTTIKTNIGMVPTEDIVQTRFLNYCCFLQTKLDFFKALESSNMNEGIKKLSIDLLSRNLENQTILHMMTKNSDIEVFKYFWQNLGKDLFNDKDIYERNLLQLAAMNNNLELILYLFSNIPDITNQLNEFDWKRKISLHYAASFGTGDMIRILLENDPEDAITEDKSFHRPIHKSIMNNNVSTFQGLLDFTEDIDERYIRGGKTILHYASEQENDEFVKILCDRNVNVNVKTDKGLTPLHLASFYGGYNIVKMLLAKGADVNAQIYEDHYTPIFYAIENWHLETVELLLKNGAHTHIVDTYAQNNLLHAAAAAGDSNVIDLLIKHNVPIDKLAVFKRTVLHTTTVNRHIEAMKTFLKYDVEVNAQDDYGHTALHMAAGINCEEIIEILLEHQANTEISNFIHSHTPIQIMLTKGNIDILKLLDAFNVPFYKKENWGAVVSSGNFDMIKYVFGKCSSDYIMSNRLELNRSFIASIHTNNCDIVKYFVELGADINFQISFDGDDDDHLTRNSKKLMNEIKILPLHRAIFLRNVDIMLVLLEEYIRLGDTSNCFDIVGEHWDFIASSNNKKAMIRTLDLFIKHGDLKIHQNKILDGVSFNNQIEMVQLLLKYGLKPDSRVIFFSLLKGLSQIAKTLIENSDINVNARDKSRRTLLHVAAINCDSVLVKFLISKGCEVNATDDGGETPIDYATITEKGPTIQVLLENNAVFSKSLSIAAENDFIGIVDLLLEKGANVNGSHAQLPPIILAIRFGSQKCIDLIINHPDVDVNIIGDKGFTPLHVAAQVGNLEVTKLLISMGAIVTIRNTQEFTPPYTAAAFGQYKTLKYYIENGYIDIKDKLPTCGRTLMHIVARKNYIQIVNYLISKKIDINVFDNEGFTPLHVAANRSTWEICNILLNSGAIYNVRRFHPFPGPTPCDMANDDSKENFLLLDELFSIVNNNDHFRLEEFIEQNNDKINLNAKDMNGYTVLHISVKEKLMKIMSILLHHRVNVNVVDFELSTPLFYAAKNNDFEIVKLLLKTGAIYNWKNANDKKVIEMTTDKRIKNMLLTIDKCFKCVETKNEKLLQLIRDVKKREDQITILFGARNNEKQCIYTYICSKNLQDMKQKLTVLLDLDGQLMRSQAVKLAQMGKYDDAKNIFQKILENYEQELGKNNPLTLDIRSDWLGVLFKLNDYEFCLKENEKIIREKTYLYGEKSLTVLHSLDLKALTLHRLGDNDEALKVYKVICKKEVDLLVEKHERVMQTKDHMALVLEALRRYEEALRLIDEVHKMRVETLGEDDPLSLISLNNKAVILNSQGNHLVAMQTYEIVHKKCLKVLGPKHPDTLTAFHNAASCLLPLKRYKEAIKKLKMLYEIQKVEFGENHIETLSTLQTLTNAYTLKGDAVKANEILTKMYPKINEIYNTDHAVLRDLSSEKIMVNPREAFRDKKLSLHQTKEIFEAIKMGNLDAMIELVKDPKLLPEIKDEIGASPLHWAADNDRMNIFLYLLSLKANPLSLTNNGNSILHTSVNKKNMIMTKAIIERIEKSHKEHFEKFINGKTIKTGKTALHVAAQKDSYEICLYLLQKGVIYNPLTSSNETPQDLPKTEIVKNLFFLIDKVFTDVENNNEHVLELIKQLPQDKSTACLQCRNAKNQTVLQSAILKRNQKIVKTLIEVLKNSGK